MDLQHAVSLLPLGAVQEDHRKRPGSEMVKLHTAIHAILYSTDSSIINQKVCGICRAENRQTQHRSKQRKKRTGRAAEPSGRANETHRQCWGWQPARVEFLHKCLSPSQVRDVRNALLYQLHLVFIACSFQALSASRASGKHCGNGVVPAPPDGPALALSILSHWAHNPGILLHVWQQRFNPLVF